MAKNISKKVSYGRPAKADGASSVINRSMPESVSAEAAVLGSMLLDNHCIGQVVEKIKSDFFYRPEHQIIFDTIVRLYEKNTGGVIDPLLLREELEDAKQLEQVGGIEYIAKILESVPSAANVEFYLNIVIDKLLLRQLIVAAGDILNDAFDESGETNLKLDEAERKIFEITDQKISGAAIPLKDLVTKAYEMIEKRDGRLVTGLDTGYFELNDKTCGLQPGEMIIVAGRPSMGKTSFALNVAEHIGVDQKAPVAFFSLEMGKQQLAERFLCSRSLVDLQRVRKGILSNEEYQKINQISGELYEAPIFIDDTSSLTPLEIRAKARRLKSQHDIRAVFIDYLQLMHMGANVESRQQEISTISRYLKALARELNIPVVVLSQLNRSPEGREGHRPRMSDLRESGSIEQDADVVILLHREDYYHRGEKDYSEDNSAELIIAKQRNGPTGTVPLRFLEKFARFVPASNVNEETAGQFDDSAEQAAPF